jgi:outer membrane receptor protein involved in Fe transport
MFYSSLEKSIKQTNIKAGLRAEQTYSDGNVVNIGQQFSRKYFGLFPSLFITQTLNEAKGNAVYISYARRLQRPTLLQLNPNRWQFDSYTSQIGNPNLLPQYSHNIQLGYNFLNKYAVDIYFTRTENVIALVANSTNNNIEYQMQNFNSSNQFGLNIAAPFTVMEGWSIMNNLSFYNLSYSINTYAANQTTLDARSIHNIVVKGIVDVDMIAGYRSASVTSNYTTPSMLYVDMVFSKKLFNNKARLRLYFTDIFNGMYEKEVTDNNSTFIDFYQKRPTRTASISFTYNFSSGKKISNKKMEQSGSEEKSRMGN